MLALVLALGHAYDVTLRLSEPRTCGTGRLMFARIAWTFVAGKPAGEPRSSAETLTCSFLLSP
jgi:hypothetical protein